MIVVIERIIHVVLALLFVLSASLQLNDPDPYLWIPMYLVAAIGSGFAAWRRGPWQMPFVVGAIAIVWALWLVPGVVGKTSLDEMTATWKMNDNPAAEAGREMGGLIIVAAAMAFATWSLRRVR